MQYLIRVFSYDSLREVGAVRSDGEMGRCGIGSSERAAFLGQGSSKQLDELCLAFFCQVVPEIHVSGTGDYLLHDPFPEVVRQCRPINCLLSVSLPERIGWWFPQKD